MEEVGRRKQGRSPNGGRRDLLSGSDETLIDLKTLTVPVLLLGGTKDPYISWDVLAEEVDEFMRPGSVRLLKFDGASHALMLEAPYYRRFQRAILRFLRQTGEE